MLTCYREWKGHGVCCGPPVQAAPRIRPIAAVNRAPICCAARRSRPTHIRKITAITFPGVGISRTCTNLGVAFERAKARADLIRFVRGEEVVVEVVGHAGLVVFRGARLAGFWLADLLWTKCRDDRRDGGTTESQKEEISLASHVKPPGACLLFMIRSSQICGLSVRTWIAKDLDPAYRQLV
jgi:hypothetical protein